MVTGFLPRDVLLAFSVLLCRTLKAVNVLLKWFYVNKTTLEQNGDHIRGSCGFKVDVLIDWRCTEIH